MMDGTSDFDFVGRKNAFKLLCQSHSAEHNWIQIREAMAAPNGCIVQVTTILNNSVAVALTYVPGAKIVEDTNDGHKLVSI
jgi:hypothetical protein